MAEYRVLSKSVINNTVVDEGEIVEWDVKVYGEPGDNLEPVKKTRAKPSKDAEPEQA